MRIVKTSKLLTDNTEKEVALAIHKNCDSFEVVPNANRAKVCKKLAEVQGVEAKAALLASTSDAEVVEVGTNTSNKMCLLIPIKILNSDMVMRICDGIILHKFFK